MLAEELAPDIDVDPLMAAGVLAINLPDGQYAVWFRREMLRSIDWGGDPHNKAIAVSEGDGVRIGPRKSFDRWSELVKGRSQRWSPIDIESADGLRHLLVESLYQRVRSELRMAETLQRSLLPGSIPSLEGWQLSAYYEPATGRHVGGDWYDAFALRDGRLIVLIGDVAGHGITAAGTMAQLRNALRAQLFAGATPAQALAELNAFSMHMVSRAFATVIVASVDPVSGNVEAASAGHLMPYLTESTSYPVQAPIRLSPPIGIRNITYHPSEFTIERGQGLVLYSDGLVERRQHSTLDEGLERLARVLDRADHASAAEIATAMADTDAEADDDVTIVTLYRL